MSQIVLISDRPVCPYSKCGYAISEEHNPFGYHAHRCPTVEKCPECGEYTSRFLIDIY